jgi:hypothetical protein
MATSQSGRTFARHVAPFAPVALALAMSSAAPSATAPATTNGGGETIVAAQCGDDITDFQSCHANYPTGCSKAGKYDAYLNELKNGLPAAPGAGITYLDQAAIDNLNTNTPSDLGKGNNHADYEDELNELGEGSQRGIIGYLYYYEHTGAESSNCELTGPSPDYGNVDFHIGLGFDPALASQVNPSSPDKPPKQLEQSSVVVEMTPHYRAQFHDGLWTLANLQPALGHRVRVVGQLLVDSEHNKTADNCALVSDPSGSRCWRYSIWELHPVTSFEYCQDDSCTQDSGNWIPLGGSAEGSARMSHAVSSEVAMAGSAGRPGSSTRTAEPQSDQASRP